jgi:cytochrome o ubiquinol oxidase subunit II
VNSRQDLKWLFIYAEQSIATVNELVFPSARPLSLRITSDTMMRSLAIPAPGGQDLTEVGMGDAASRVVLRLERVAD